MIPAPADTLIILNPLSFKVCRKFVTNEGEPPSDYALSNKNLSANLNEETLVYYNRCRNNTRDQLDVKKL